MRKLKVLVLSLVFVFGGSVFAAPAQNATFDAPEIGAITCDGNLSDWSDSSPWSLPYIFWNGTSTSTTRAKFAWSDTDDLLYVVIETNESMVQVGGHAVIGMSLNLYGHPNTAVGATQLTFDADTGNSVVIGNEIQRYNDLYDLGWAGGGIVGVQAGQSFAAGITTYEIAIPLWTDWTVMTNKQALFAGTVVYLYSVMETAFGTGNGTDLTYNGNAPFATGAFDDGTAITLMPKPAIPANCEEAKIQGYKLEKDLNGDCYINLADFALFAQSWLM